jgi:hypothetical protein
MLSAHVKSPIEPVKYEYNKERPKYEAHGRRKLLHSKALASLSLTIAVLIAVMDGR